MKKRPNATPSGPAGHSRQAFQGGTYSLMLTAAVLALLLGVALAALLGVWLDGAQAALSDRVIRLHVLANSDSEADQALKLRVRDAVLALSLIHI